MKGKSYALLADESRDVAGHQQLSIVVRYISDTNTTDTLIEECLLDLIALHSFDAASLTTAIVSVLEKHGIDLKLCIALCFDG